MWYRSIFIFALLSFGAIALAEPVLPFGELWQKIEQQDPSLEQKQLEKQAAQAGAKMAQNHWLPRLRVGSQVLSSDAPGTALFMKLGQTEIEAADFDPTDLNNPGRETYILAGAQLDWALYEGGRGRAGAKAGSQFLAAAGEAEQGQKLFTYIDALKNYRDLLTFQKENSALQEVGKLVDRVVARYQVGRKGNPVGYSGLLGLKGLRNRVSGLIETNRAQSQGIRASLSQQAGGLPKDWQPVASGKSWLALSSQRQNSPRAKALQLQAQGKGHMADAQKSRWLPQVGARVNYDRVQGDRGEGDAVSGGLYLQWELLSPENRGSFRQAHFQAQAAEAAARVALQQEEVQWQESQSALSATRENLKLLAASDQLLSEQMRVSQKLFLNGSMNALQLTEVLSRRVDLLLDQSKAQRQLHSLEGAQFMLSGGKLP